MVPRAPLPSAPQVPGRESVFGRFELRQRLGKSAGATLWLAFDPTSEQEVYLTVPMVQPLDAVALELWSLEVRRAARLAHPNLAPVLEIGLHKDWPYVVVARQWGLTLGEWLAMHPSPLPTETVKWVCQALLGLAFSHESGCSHNDIQLHSLIVNEKGEVRLMALASAGDMSGIEAARSVALNVPSVDPSTEDRGLMALRKACERDVLACGLLLHRLLAGTAPLEQPDIARAIARMPPFGRDIVHLPWTTLHPVEQGLRAIVNRSTGNRERQRYLNARTLLRALDGWQLTQAEDGAGPLALLLDRLDSVGHLPALPGLAARVERLIAMEGQHTDTMVTELLQDMALSLELLRQVNSAQVRNARTSDNGPVLTIRRSIALLGIDGVRHAANGLRRWPGPMSDAAALKMKRLMDQVHLAGHVAQALRPAGYDAEVIYLVTLLQNLGRLMVQYHFPDEAEQIQQLTAPPDAGVAPASGEAEVAGLGEAAASFAVLGVDLEAVGAAVARHWGLGAELQHMIHRVELGTRVRSIQSDVDALCKTASAANEVVDAISQLPPARANRVLDSIAQRYARALKISLRDVQDAIQSARENVRNGGVVAARHAESITSPDKH